MQQKSQGSPQKVYSFSGASLENEVVFTYIYVNVRFDEFESVFIVDLQAKKDHKKVIVHKNMDMT